MSMKIQIPTFFFLSFFVCSLLPAFAIDDNCADFITQNDPVYKIGKDNIINLIKNSTEYLQHIAPREPLWQYPSISYGGVFDNDKGCQTSPKFVLTFE